METRDPVLKPTCKTDSGRSGDMGFGRRAAGLGARVAGEGLIVPFYGIDHRVTTSRVKDAAGRSANPAVSTVLLNYILRCPQTPPPDGPWITFREFSGAGPLMGYFTENTNKLLESTFSENGDVLQKACLQYGATVLDEPGYDISMEFCMLPMVPLRFRFNLKEAEFPAQCSLLFKKSAEAYLEMKPMAIACTWLAGGLIGFQRGGNSAGGS